MEVRRKANNGAVRKYIEILRVFYVNLGKWNPSLLVDQKACRRGIERITQKGGEKKKKEDKS